MKKRILLLMLVVFTFAACSKKTDRYSVGFVTDGEKVLENNRTAQIQNGIKKIDKVDLTTVTSNTKESYLKNIDTLVKRQNKFIIGNSFLLNEEFKRMAELNNEVQFVLFDSIIEKKHENITSIFFKTNESSYLAGYLAGLATKTNKVAYVGAEKGSWTDFYEYGFKAGVHTASKELEKNIEIIEEYIYKHDDFELGKKLGDEIYSKDVDIIYQNVGVTGLGLIQSAKDKGKYIIGSDIDQQEYAPKNVIASTIKNYQLISEKVILEHIYGKKEKLGKQSFGLIENAVDLKMKLEENSPLKELYIKVMSKKERIKNKEILIPFDEETFKNFLSES